MFQAMTKEETERYETRIAELASSPMLVERIMAVLMDTKYGGTGIYENCVRAKATRIAAELQTVADGLARYIHHDEGCAYLVRQTAVVADSCDCGLVAALAAYNQAKEASRG